MISGGYTATGPRAANEDNMYFRDFESVGLIAGGISSFVMVSDGMGGYQCGDVASGLAVASAKSYIEQLLEMARGNLVDLDPQVALGEIIRNGHEAILMEAKSRGNIGMGATIVAAFVSPTHAWIAHVGDSRAYIISNGIANQITEDHSKVGRLLSHGVISEAEAQNHPERNRIERALGFGDATPDYNEIDFQPNAALLLCSDGVYTVLNSSRLCDDILSSRDASTAAKNVVQHAIKRGTDDNSTAVVLMGDELTKKVSKTHTIQAKKISKSDTLPHAPYAAMPRNSSVRPTLFIVLVALVSIGIIAALVIAALQTSGKESDGSGSNAAATTNQGMGDSQGDGTTSPDSTHSLNDSPFERFTIPEHGDVVLKYVDSENVAQLFSYPPYEWQGSVRITPGSTIIASTRSSQLGRQGKTYQQLSDDYMRDLRADVEKTRMGDESYSSSLSSICDLEAYTSLVKTLAESNLETLDGTVIHLVIEALPEDEESVGDDRNMADESTSSNAGENAKMEG